MEKMDYFGAMNRRKSGVVSGFTVQTSPQCLGECAVLEFVQFYRNLITSRRNQRHRTLSHLRQLIDDAVDACLRTAFDAARFAIHLKTAILK